MIAEWPNRRVAQLPELLVGKVSVSPESDIQELNAVPWMSDSPEKDIRTSRNVSSLTDSGETDNQGVLRVFRMADSAESDTQGAGYGAWMSDSLESDERCGRVEWDAAFMRPDNPIGMRLGISTRPPG